MGLIGGRKLTKSAKRSYKIINDSRWYTIEKSRILNDI
jgi:hypothetical protein